MSLTVSQKSKKPCAPKTRGRICALSCSIPRGARELCLMLLRLSSPSTRSCGRVRSRCPKSAICGSFGGMIRRKGLVCQQLRLLRAPCSSQPVPRLSRGRIRTEMLRLEIPCRRACMRRESALLISALRHYVRSLVDSKAEERCCHIWSG